MLGRISFNESLVDAQLNIQTTGRNDNYSDTLRYPYEPTSYEVLDRIADEGYISKEDVLVDYGSGKGRVPIYCNYKVGCKTIGVEMMSEFISIAEENKARYVNSDEVEFVCEKAEKWPVPIETTSFFFFNPFSVKIMRGVMKNILDSFYDKPRHMKLFFYYPSDDYVAFLATVEELDFVDEIDCTDIFAEYDLRNRVLVYEIGD